jgi:hypothetical protein
VFLISPWCSSHPHHRGVVKDSKARKAAVAAGATPEEDRKLQED